MRCNKSLVLLARLAAVHEASQRQAEGLASKSAERQRSTKSPESSTNMSGGLGCAIQHKCDRQAGRH